VGIIISVPHKILQLAVKGGLFRRIVTIQFSLGWNGRRCDETTISFPMPAKDESESTKIGTEESDVISGKRSITLKPTSIARKLE